MTRYFFICPTPHGETRYPADLRSDMVARTNADAHPTAIRVETGNGRVVWRRPLGETEYNAIMKGRNGRS